MYGKFGKKLQDELESIKQAGLYKRERIITTSQGASIRVSNGNEVLNFCANNYLGLSSHPKVIQGAKDALDTHGYGMSSVRFICGTQDIHKNLEKKISNFLVMEDTILYAAAFDANGGLFEPLFGKEDAIISDSLNHASIIDGVRVTAPMMSIHTVAAGGGSLLKFDGVRMRVGPESSGANPGPVCYANDGVLSLTDANIVTGRLQPDFFPEVFGKEGNSGISSEKSFQAFKAISKKLDNSF